MCILKFARAGDGSYLLGMHFDLCTEGCVSQEPYFEAARTWCPYCASRRIDGVMFLNSVACLVVAAPCLLYKNHLAFLSTTVSEKAPKSPSRPCSVEAETSLGLFVRGIITPVPCFVRFHNLTPSWKTS